MSCCIDDLGDYSVTPMLMATGASEKCCETPLCYPCLPRCPKGQVVYYCVKPQSKSSKSPDESYQEMPKNAFKRRTPCPPEEYCCPTCKNTCKQVKTKYVIPCYRYEDGRIVNQPTVLMRRACEVAVGARPRRKPFVVSSFSSDPDQEVHRYVCQDERGNCCYHFEKKNHECCRPCNSCPQYGDCVPASAVELPNGCYFHCC